jgi:tyrosinase
MSTPANPFVRRNAWTLPAGDRTLEEYAEAITIMKHRPASDPTSWTYQAAMHGTHTVPTRPLWNGCQHGTWFFVAWHRLFLYYFERIVRAAVIQAGGSADWALPYWNYEGGGQQAAIPDRFRHPTINGVTNPLFVSQRSPSINAGLALPASITRSAHAMSRARFKGTTRFGGGPTPVQQFSNSPGQLELMPHNTVHSAVGGWMGDVDAAAADPIFWLHHSNIDRLWFLWANPPHKNPGDPVWTGQTFSFFDEHRAAVQKTPADALDTVAQLGYTYEPVPAPLAPAPTPKEEPPMMIAGDSEDEPQPELVGASEQSLQLVGVPANVALEIDATARDAVLASTGRAEPDHIYLSVDDIDGEKAPETVYGVYVNLPEGADGEDAESYQAGSLSFFGLERARNPRGDEQAHMLRFTREITKLAERLAAKGEWDGQHVNVTFRPLTLIPHDQPELAHALPESMSDSDPPVTLGRVSIFYA